MATGVSEFALEGSIEYKERGSRRLLKKKKKKVKDPFEPQCSQL